MTSGKIMMNTRWSFQKEKKKKKRERVDCCVFDCRSEQIGHAKASLVFDVYH